MGAVAATYSTYTEQDIDQQIAKLTPRLPIAQLMNGGMIKLEGVNGFFNPNSLLDPSWLKDKITIEEYTQAIDYINKRTGYTQKSYFYSFMEHHRKYSAFT